ncbi:lonely Cys domain-containing protein, partial [Streptomyces albus]|uniref:lonely Cys domain-containing protein n=1 Tax=Streptomyces albus TaxID=1888 RepID=UPI000AC70F0F
NPRPRPAGARIDEELDERRPARIDTEMLPPPQVHRPSTFTDETRMPGYVDGFLPFPGDESDGTSMAMAFGQSDVHIRGWEQITEQIDIGMEAHGPDNASGEEISERHQVRGGGTDESVFRRIQRAMRERPLTFAGDGREFVYRTRSGLVRKVHIRIRNYGEWTKFTDGASPTKVDNAQRAQTTVGGSKTVGQTRQFAPTAPLGPQSSLFSAWGRIGLRFGRLREVAYSAQDQVLNVAEVRGLDTSHLYLDDAYVEVRITDAEPPRPAKPGVLGTSWRAREARTAVADVEFAFGVRHGLKARLTESATAGTKPGRTPRTLRLGPESDYRLVITEDFGPVAHIRDWAVRRIGAEPDSSAYRELGSFFSSGNFHQIAGRLARSAVPGNPLFADDKKKTPLGAFIVERVVPTRAVLATETDKAELRDSAFLTVQNTRKQTKAHSADATIVVGPTFNTPSLGGLLDLLSHLKLRIQLGPSARIGHVRGRSAMTGGSGAVRSVGRAKNVTTDLYRVEKTVWVRKTGDAHPTPFTTWSLDRMTRTEARRLAGMEDENAFARTEPFAPAYLTRDNPPTLGMSRPVQFLFADGRYSRKFPARTQGTDLPAQQQATAQAADSPTVTFAERTRLDSFTRQVLTAVADKYPNMVARWEDLGDPGDKRWRDHAHYQMVLHNTLTVVNALSHHSMAGNLETMSRTGLRIGLVNPGRFSRGYYYIWIDAELTNRTWVSPTDTILRHSAPGATRLDESRYGVQGAELGFEAVGSLRDTTTDNIGFPAHAFTGQGGYQAGWQTRDESAYGSTATFDQMAITTKPGNLYSYDLALTVSTGGYWRPRSLLRGLVSFGILGTQLFVMGPKGRGDIIGGNAAVPAVRGKVLLSVPADHSPATDPHAPGADNPYLDPNPVVSRPMTRTEARKLLDASTESGWSPGPLDGLPHQTLSVVAPKQDRGVVDRVLAKASHDRWQLTREGAPAHDAAVRPGQPQYLTANADQNAGATGSRTTGLFGKGPYIDWLATVVHRMRITNLRALTRPQPMETEMTLGGSTKASGAQSKSFTQQAGISFVYGHSHQQGPGVTGSYGAVWRPWWRNRSSTGTVTRTVTSDINRVDQGHQVLANGDAEHEVAAETRSSGLLSPLGAIVRRLHDWAGERLTVRGGWLGHLPERTAHQLGLIEGDDLGGGPTYAARRWLQPRWFRKAPFATYPVNSLDTTEVVERFQRRLDELGLDEDSREAVLRLTSSRVTRALRREMTGTGSSVTGRIRGAGWKRLRVGGRDVRIRARLEPVGEPEFVRLWPRTELEDHRWAVESFSDAFGTGRGSDAGTIVNEGVHTGNAVAPMSGPSLTETGSNRQNIAASDTRVRGRLWTSYTSEPHAEFATRYRLRLTMEVGRKRGEDGWGRPARRIEESGEAGSQREIVPLSLMRPDATPGAPNDGTDPLAPPEIADTPPAVRILTADDSPLHRPEEDSGGILLPWRSVTLPDGTRGPFVPPENGFHVRNLIGAENVLAASTLALAKAYDNRLADLSGNLSGDELQEALRRARITPLTAEGTGSAQVLEDAHGPGALSAFFEHASSDAGYETSGLVENALSDRSEGLLQVFSRPDFTRARLFAVADGARMESSTRVTQSDNATTSQGGDHNTVLGGAPALKSDSVGTANPGATGTGADTADSDGRVTANDQARQVNVKTSTGRVFAFVIPTAWLSVADVHRQFKDSSGSEWVRKHLFGSLGGVKPGPQAVEAQTHVVAWVREDVARQLGLITDENFPETVAKAWDKVKDAAKTWADEDGKYWELRRDLPDLRETVEATRAARAVARQERRLAERAARAERTAAGQDFRAAMAAARVALRQPPADFPDPVAGTLRSALDRAARAAQDHRDSLLHGLTDTTPAPERAAAEARIETTRQALDEANALVASIRRTEHDRLAAEARREFDARRAAADGSVASARDAAHAAARAYRSAVQALDTRLTEIAEQETKAEQAAANLHRLRAQTDRLTRWYRLPEDPPSAEEGAVPTRGGVPEPTVTDLADTPVPPKLTPGGLETIPEDPEDPEKEAAATAVTTVAETATADGTAAPGTTVPGTTASGTTGTAASGTAGTGTTGTGTTGTGTTGTGTGPGTSTGTQQSPGTEDGTSREEPPADPPRYALVTALDDGVPALRSPEGTTHRLRDVGADNSFFRALQQALPAARTHTDGTALDAAALRRAFADTVEALPPESPLLAYFSPDETDTFTSAELDAAALDLGTDTPQRREFDALGVIPHSAGDRPSPDRRYQPLSPDQRRGLAAAQLRRAADAADETGWNHSAADLLPALAARRYGVGVRVVREDGTYQDFPPDPSRPLADDAERVVLYLADGHFQGVEARAVAEGPPPPPKPQPPVDESLLTAHATRPWTWEGLDEATYKDQPKFDAATDHRTLTDPDGFVYDLVRTGIGDGNLFYSAVAVALGADPRTGEGFGVVDDLAELLDTATLPADVRLDPRATYTAEELEEAGFGSPLPDGLRRELERDGGRLPRSLRPTPDQVRDLVRAQLRAARRWNRDTAMLAARLVAEGMDLHVTFVHENGTIDTFGTASEDGGNAIVLYERGGDFLAAVPRGSGNPRVFDFRTTRPTPSTSTAPPPEPTRPAPLPPVVVMEPSGPPGGKGRPKPAPAGSGGTVPVNQGVPFGPGTTPAPAGTRSPAPQPGRTELRDALERLDTLREDVPALEGGPFDLDAVARHVLLLPPDAVVTETHRAVLLDAARAPEMAAVPSLAVLAGFVLDRRGARAVRDFGWDVDAFAARVLHLGAPEPAQRPRLLRLLERASHAEVDLGSSVRLGAFHLATQGVLTPERIIRRPDGSPVGRDLDVRLDAMNLDPSEVTVVGVGPDRRLIFDETEAAPWYRRGGPQPWVVRVAGPLGEALLSGRVPAEDVAHLVHIDPARPHDGDIVLLLPVTDPETTGAGVETVLDAVTRSTDARTHSAYGRMDFLVDEEGRATIALSPDAWGRQRTVTDILTAGPATAEGARTTGAGPRRPRPRAGAKRPALSARTAPAAKRQRRIPPAATLPAAETPGTTGTTPALAASPSAAPSTAPVTPATVAGSAETTPSPSPTVTPAPAAATSPAVGDTSATAASSTAVTDTSATAASSTAVTDSTATTSARTAPSAATSAQTAPSAAATAAATTAAASVRPATAPIMTVPVGSTPGWARGRPLPVAGDGNCMLHAFLAGNPLLVRDRLPALSRPDRSADDRDAHAWLSDPGAVRTELARGGTPSRTDRHVLGAMRDFIADYLTRNQDRLPVEIVLQYRSTAPDGPAADVDTMDEVELVTRLTGLGVAVPDQSRFPSAHGLLGEMRDLVLRHTPLTDTELAGLRSAVLDWGNRWHTDVGDTFPHLLAHAFGVRMTLAWSQHRADGQTVRRGLRPGIGPEDATWEIELFYRSGVTESGRPAAGTEHYEGSDASPRLVADPAASVPLAAPPAGTPVIDPGSSYSGRPRGGALGIARRAHAHDDRPSGGRPDGGRRGAVRRGGKRRGADHRTAQPYVAPFPAGPSPQQQLAQARIEALWAADPELRDRPFDMDRLVRRVLLLTPQERVTGAQRAEVYRLASTPEGHNARSLAGLTALYLVRRGALDDRFRLTDAQGRRRGLNWTDTLVPADLDMTSTAVRTDESQGSTVGEVGPALWAMAPGRPGAYLLVASGGRQVRVRGRAGFERDVPAEVLAELLALDQVLSAQPWDVPVAMQVPGFARSVTGPSTVATRLDRNVVATSGVPAVMLPPSGTSGPVFGLVDEPGRPRGSFVLSVPDPAGPYTARPDWERAVDIFPIATADGWMTGFVSVDTAIDPDGGRARLANAMLLPSVTSYMTYDTQLGKMSAPRNVPWQIGRTGFAAQHGLPDSVAWEGVDGPLRMSGSEHAHALAHWFSRLPSLPDRALIICFSAARPGIGGVVTGETVGPLPFVPDPLAVRPVGQRVANQNGATVYAPRLKIDVSAKLGSPVTVVMLSNVRGEGAELVKFQPEPEGAALDERARMAGLHHGPGPATEAVRQRALRLVCALREVFADPDIDDRPDYPDLLRGIGALDLMRERDPGLNRDGARLFTLDLLERVVLGFGPASASAAPVTPERIRDVLGWADAAWQARPRPLTRFVALPHVVAALSRLPAAGTPMAEAAARALLDLGPGERVGEAELSRMLWADVRLRELLDTVQDPGRFAATVLHLDRPDPARFDEAVELAGKALAAGRFTLPEIAAYHLESQGALSDSTLGRNGSGAVNGRDLRHGSAGLDGDFDPSVVTLLDHGPDGQLVEVGTVPAPWYAKDRPAPWSS